jgi:hypothetical protein
MQLKPSTVLIIIILIILLIFVVISFSKTPPESTHSLSHNISTHSTYTPANTVTKPTNIPGVFVPAVGYSPSSGF